MMFDDPCTWFTAGSHCKSDHAIVRLYLNDQSAQNIQTKCLSTFPISGIFRHGRRHMIVNPMVLFLVVVVTSTISDDISAYLPDLRFRHKEMRSM